MKLVSPVSEGPLCPTHLNNSKAGWNEPLAAEDDSLYKFSQSSQRKRVRFADVASMRTFERVPQHEWSAVWYTGEHFKCFREETRHQAARLQVREKFYGDYNSPCQSLLRVYHGFRSMDKTEEIQQLLESTQHVSNLDEDYLGLVLIAIPAIADDYQVRRKHVIETIRLYQCAVCVNDSERAELIGQTSRLTSKASRWFARYLAHLTWEDERKESFCVLQKADYI